MKFAIIGLGKMGRALVLNALEKGLDVVAYNRTSYKIEDLKKEADSLKQMSYNYKLGRLITCYTVKDLVEKLSPPRIILLMVSAGSPVDAVISELIESDLKKGDIIIEGGNSNYKDSQRRYKELKEKGICFLDMGTSGGIEGARRGACFMVGGDEQAYRKVEPILKALAVEGGAGLVGASGAGHFVKIIHNGIEYGILQAIGEGFEVLKKGSFNLDLFQVASIYSNGSVIRGWLMDLLVKALKDDSSLSSFSGVIGGGQTGKWAYEIAKELKVDISALQSALKKRSDSVTKPTFCGKIIAALRYQFGGHKQE